MLLAVFLYAIWHFFHVLPTSFVPGRNILFLAFAAVIAYRSGARKVRTVLSRENTLILSFFRSQGMMAGPFIPLEMDLET